MEVEVRAVAVSGYRLVIEDGPDLSDSSDDVNKPDELENMHAPGCSESDARLGGLEAFISRRANQADPRPIAIVQEMAGRQGIVSGVE